MTSSKIASPEIAFRGTILNQLLAGPSYQEVGAKLLKDALNQLYPTLDIDPENTAVGTPGWDMVDGKIVDRPTRYQTLCGLLIERVMTKDPAPLINGFQFLTRLPISTPVNYLPVHIDQIECMINELVPAMQPGCQEQQLAYWNSSTINAGPRWHGLSSTLRGIWNVQQVEGWTPTECDMARQLFLYPDLSSRKANAKYGVHAYLIDIDGVDGDKVTHLNEVSIVVLIGTIQDKEIILTYSILDRFQKFSSREALGQSLPAHLTTRTSDKIQWRLYEPAGKIFDYQACGLIAMQVGVLGSLDFVQEPGTDMSSDKMQNQPAIKRPDPEATLGQAWLERHLPDWLQAASTSDQALFADHMKDLSALSNSHAGKTYLDDIPSITDFASNALKQQMQSKHANASTLDIGNIEIEVRSPVVWGTFVVPNKIDVTRFKLVELALQNLIALPLGDKTVSLLDGSALPTWLTIDYIEELITEVDIGRTYPALIKRKLLDDPAELTRRQTLYTSQLRIQLPMLALESKIRGKGNLDERGSRYVAAVMKADEEDRQVDGQPIVLRRLAFVSNWQSGSSPDAVANMFVIGPQNPEAGPCVLYQPLLEPQLSQYSSPGNLLYAIGQTASLRQSVLAWLPDDVRGKYSRYVFSGPVPSPWTVVDFLASPAMSLLDSSPVTLSNATLDPDFMPLLFSANANALVALADRQSVSNSENRWETYKQVGWAIFNLVLPYLGNTIGAATWLWQILDDVDQLTQHSKGASAADIKWRAVVDLLLNLSMALSAIAINRVRGRGEKSYSQVPEEVPALENLPKPEPIIEERAPFPSTDRPPEHYDAIHASGALFSNYENLLHQIEPFLIDKPDGVGQAQSMGALKGLYDVAGKRYALLKENWFEVDAQGEQVFIVDPKNPKRTGPPLMSDDSGSWYIDTRLRLRGDGHQGAVQKVKADAIRRRPELLAKLNEFERQKPENQKLLTADAKELENASGTTLNAKRDAYVSTLKTQRESYEEALTILAQWPIFQSVPNHTQYRVNYLKAQINFTFAEIDMLQERFTSSWRKARQMIIAKEPVLEQHHIDSAQQMIIDGDNMIERLDYMETRFSKLKNSGREGFELISQYRKKLPTFNNDDLRLVQLDMYRYLCLAQDSFNTVPEGWADVNQMVDNITICFQSFRDTINERSVLRLDEQIDALGGLTEQFTAISEHLDYIGSEYQENARPEQLARLRRQIGLQRKRALRQLADALEERNTRRSEASAYQQRPAPRKKFIRARFWGIVSGTPRLSANFEETDLLDVKNPFTDEIITTFHHKPTGEWVPRVKPNVQTNVPALQTSMKKGNALIAELAASNSPGLERLTQANRTPTGNGLIMHAHAARMEHISVAITKALAAAQPVVSNETVSVPAAEQLAAKQLCVKLDTQAQRLHALSFETELKAIKQSAPTMSNVMWLNNRNHINITKLTTRQRSKGPHFDYLDRYEITDIKDKKVLWYADFHYSQSWLPNHSFSSARLKTPAQVAPGAAPMSNRGLSQRTLLDLYRSEIAVDQAKEVFFPPLP